MAFSPKNLFLVLFAVGVLAVLVFLSPSGFFPREKPATTGTAGAGASPLEGLSKGKQVFSIASAAEARPRFAEAVIDPLKVSTGDTQKMRVVVYDDAEVVSVAAEIETDNDTVNIPLRLGEKTTATREELNGQKYIVQEGKLIINDSDGGSQLNMPVVQAADLRKFVFEGEWVVRDTSVRTYRTKFVARDAEGRENSITMAWSDPCPGITDGVDSTLSVGCSIGANTVDGIDEGGLIISGVSTALTLSGPGAVFVYNPGKSISLQSGASVVLASGAELRKTYLWAQQDQDKDGYADSGTWAYGDTCSGCTRRYQFSGSIGDCYYALPTSTTRAHLAHPYSGQAPFFTAPRGDGSFDYNCDALAEKNVDIYETTCNTDSEATCSIAGGCFSTCSTSVSFTPACGLDYLDRTAEACQGTIDCGTVDPNCAFGNMGGTCAFTGSGTLQPVACR